MATTSSKSEKEDQSLFHGTEDLSQRDDVTTSPTTASTNEKQIENVTEEDDDDDHDDEDIDIDDDEEEDEDDEDDDESLDSHHRINNIICQHERVCFAELL